MLDLEVVKKPSGRKKNQDKNTITMSNESNNLQQENLKDLLWDAEQAKQRLAINDRFTAGTVRAEVYKHNLKIFEAWKYVAPSGKVIKLPGTRQELLDATRVYREVICAAEVPVRYQTTRTGCANEDCMVVAKNLIDQGLNPAILNMANAYKACGKYSSGDGSQEPSLCRASTLSPTLYQYYNKMWAKKAGVTLREPSAYPIDVRFGGIYTPNVTVFRDNGFTGFALHEQPYKTSIISMGALNFNPKIKPNNMEYRAENDGFTPEGEEVMRDKIRTIYRIALLNGHDSLVLGAFGCGAFHLQPEFVSTLFKETLEETEFKGKFHTIAFALLEGSGPRKKVEEEGKLASFYQQFGRLP